MGESPQLLEIIIFAMIAVFLGLRLRSVLGRRDLDNKTPTGEPATVIDLSARRQIAARQDDPLSNGLAAIMAADPSFSQDQFMRGAESAFEMIVKAFAAGDMATLRPLLSEKVFADFAAAISARAQQQDDPRMELLRVVSATMAEAQLSGGIAEIAVRFVSEQKAADGHETRLIDLWRFARPVPSQDPNWRLVATGSLDE